MSEPLPSPSSSSPAEPASEIRQGPLKARWNRLASSRIGKGAQLAYTWRRPMLFGFGVSFFVGRYYYMKYQAAKRDFVHPETYLIWRLYDGAIVEYPSTQTNLNMLLGSSGDGSEPPRVMTLHDVLRTLKFVETDDRITGLIADMSSTNAPSVNNVIPLGLAQIEEIQQALLELKLTKNQRLGRGKFKTAAFTETFRSQGEYAMASGFDEVYCQPTGEIPLVGINGTVTFYSKLLKWLGIKVHAEARTHYKSMVAPYTQEQFTEAQAENHIELLNDLNANLLALIASNRFTDVTTLENIPSPKSTMIDVDSLMEKVKGYSQRGPIMAKEAIELGLITGTTYKEEFLQKVMFGPDPIVVDELGEKLDGNDKIQALKEMMKKRTKGFYHYHRIIDRFAERKNKKQILNVGVVYVLGTIGDVGEFGTGAIVQGLKEAAEDDTIGTVILRIDSGGGGVVESDTIWGAVKELKAKGKVVVASFGNAAASGGYLIATHTDSIFASPSTITGSIGVASLRPTVTQSFLDRLKLTTQSFFTGSSSLSLYHELEGDQLARHKAHIDAAYEDFKGRVCNGRDISPDLIEQLAGGRVYTGLKICELIDDLSQEPNAVAEEATWQAEVVEALTTSHESSSIKDLDSESTVNSQTTEILALSVPLENDKLIEQKTEANLKSKDSPDLVTVDVSETQGPCGRGIIDGIGGIRDAAIHGVETYLTRLLSQTRESDPDKTQEEIMEEVLPGVSYVTNDEGQLVMSFDIRLKKFPVHKTFWEQLAEASQRGDALEGPSNELVKFVQGSFTKWLTKALIDSIKSDVNQLTGIKGKDLEELKELVELSSSKNRKSVKAQISHLNLN